MSAIQAAEQACRERRVAVDANAVARGAVMYRRAHLPQLINFTLDELADMSREQILTLLEKYLRAEDARLANGHWTYDRHHHLALRMAWAGEFAFEPEEVA